MNSVSLKWVVYTIIIGLLPAMIRIFLWAVFNNGKDGFAALSPFDFSTFGLVLQVSSFIEIKNLPQKLKGEDLKHWKDLHFGVTIVFIALFTAMIAAGVLSESPTNEANWYTLLIICITACLFSAYHNYSVYHKAHIATLK